MNFLELLNAVAKVAKPSYVGFTEMVDASVPFKDCGLDSLDMLMISVYMCEIYGIPEEIGKEMKVSTPAEMYQFIMDNKSQEPTSVAEAVASIK